MDVLRAPDQAVAELLQPGNCPQLRNCDLNIL